MDYSTEKVQLSQCQFRLLRMKAQGLVHGPHAEKRTVEQVTASCGGTQAQELPSGLLGLNARGNWLTLADLEQARLQTRSLVRTWMMRGTLHLVATEDWRWMLPLLAPLMIPGDRRRLAELGWDEERTRQGSNLLQNALSEEGGLTRKEIIQRLEAHHLPFEGQAPIHLIFRAAWEGILIQGPDRGKQPTFVSAEAWAGSLHPLPRDTALADLAQRYLQAYAPAGPEDLSAWSGLRMGEARQAWQGIDDLLLPVEVDGKPAWMLKAQLPWLDEIADLPPQVRLLPRFDNLLLGYASREWLIPVQLEARIKAGGILAATLVVDGRILGIWRTKASKNIMEIDVEPFESLPPAILPGLEAEARRLSAFWSVKTILANA